MDKDPLLAAEDYSLTNQEIDFLLEIINKKETNDNDEEFEEELTNFLKGQLLRLKEMKKEETDQSVSEEAKINSLSQSEVIIEDCSNKDSCCNLKKLLESKLGKYIVVNLKLNGDCCQLEGVLCKIDIDFITLIVKQQVIQIKIEAIVAIKEKIDFFKDSQAQQDRRIDSNLEKNDSKLKKDNLDLEISEQAKKINNKEYQTSSVVKESLEVDNDTVNNFESEQEEIENEFINKTVDQKQNLEVKKSEKTYTEVD